MTAAIKGKCQKCQKDLVFNKDPFVPAYCKCGQPQIQPFKQGGIQFHKLIASSPLFLLFYGLYEEKNLYVNITVLRKDVDDYDWCLKLAREQAETITKLRHLNICPIFDYKEIDGYFCVTNPALDGAPLSSYLPEKQGLIEITKLIDLLQATALGLGVAHYKKIDHHNIWPASIHVDARGIVRIKDFFISRYVYFYDQKRIKRTNHIYTSVSPYYISPEKVESGAEDTRGDVFSFGVMFYYFITGKYPYQGKHEIETIYKRAKLKNKAKKAQLSLTYSIPHDDLPDFIPPATPKHVRDEIPSGISELIMQMISYYPNDRPTFSEIINTFNLLRAKKDVLNIRKAQEEIIDTDTKGIPKMRSIFKGRAEDFNKEKIT